MFCICLHSMLVSLHQENELELVAVRLEPLQHDVLGEYIQPVETTGKQLSDVAMTTCTAVCDWLKTGSKTQVFSEAMVSCINTLFCKCSTE